MWLKKANDPFNTYADKVAFPDEWITEEILKLRTKLRDNLLSMNEAADLDALVEEGYKRGLNVA